MLKLLLVCALLALASGKKSGKNGHECRITDGKTLQTFGGSKEEVKFSCKFHAIRDTICGDYDITITPRMLLTKKKSKKAVDVYYIESLFVRVKRDGKVLLMRTDWNISNKFLSGKKNQSFNEKGGSYGMDEVFLPNLNPNSTQKLKKIELIEKNGVFSIEFGLFDWMQTKTSTFSFKCFDDNFVPRPYGEQLCGNGTKGEVDKQKEALDLKGNRRAITVLNVFNPDVDVDQRTQVCKEATTTLSNCAGHELQASLKCWSLTFKDNVIKCLKKNGAEPMETFSNCLKYICGSIDSSSCETFKDQTNGCKLEEWKKTEKILC